MIILKKTRSLKLKMMYLTDIIQYLITQKKLLIPVKKICDGVRIK